MFFDQDGIRDGRRLFIYQMRHINGNGNTVFPPRLLVISTPGFVWLLFKGGNNSVEVFTRLSSMHMYSIPDPPSHFFLTVLVLKHDQTICSPLFTHAAKLSWPVLLQSIDNIRTTTGTGFNTDLLMLVSSDNTFTGP